MNKLIDCGRCFWGSDREQALVRSDAMSLEFAWNLDEQNDYQLENSPQVALLTQFMKAPPLPLAHAQAVSNYLASRLPENSLPLPAKPNFVRIDETPKPVLVLQSRDESPDIRDFFASIKFRYADYLLPFDGLDADASLEGKTTDGSPLVLKRDLHAEVRTATRSSTQKPTSSRAPAIHSAWHANGANCLTAGTS